MKRLFPLFCAFGFQGAGADQTPGIVSGIMVLSDKVEDVSSLEAWKGSFVRDGMTDREKAMAVWKSVAAFQFQDAPPKEYLQVEDMVLDPIKGMNVYGYSFCSVASAHVQALAREAGLEARGWTLLGHVVPEVKWDEAWHLLDASLLAYFPKADGDLAGVEEILAGVKGWYAANPGFSGDENKLREFMRGGGWRKGPEILSRTDAYDENGWLPAATHGWYSSMIEYSGTQGTPFVYEPGYSLGYRVNIQLREGEVLQRNWSNRGLHVNMDEGDSPGALTAKTGEGDLRYSPAFGDLAPGRLGNGTLVYTPPLASGAFRSGALLCENLAARDKDGTGPALQLVDSSKPGVYEIRMPSSYVYLDGKAELDAKVGMKGKITIAFSANNGLDWEEIAVISESGKQSLDLRSKVFRRYDYRLRFTIEAEGSGLEGVEISHTVQHSQRPLPALGEGKNTIHFSTANEGTVTVEGSTRKENAGRQLLYTDFHARTEGVAEDSLNLTGGSGSVIIPVSTPGPMKRLRVHLYYRLRDAADKWEAEVSFDKGATFRSIAEMTGPTVGASRSILVEDVPENRTEAVVRLRGTQRNTSLIHNLRLDADYAELNGGFRPVEITYGWEESGVPKSDTHVARKSQEEYTIVCGAKPMMKSIRLALAR